MMPYRIIFFYPIHSFPQLHLLAPSLSTYFLYFSMQVPYTQSNPSPFFSFSSAHPSLFSPSAVHVLFHPPISSPPASGQSVRTLYISLCRFPAKRFNHSRGMGVLQRSEDPWRTCQLTLTVTPPPLPERFEAAISDLYSGSPPFNSVDSIHDLIRREEKTHFWTVSL